VVNMLEQVIVLEMCTEVIWLLIAATLAEVVLEDTNQVEEN